MPYNYEPEFQQLASPILEAFRSRPRVPVHDIQGRRQRMEGFAPLIARIPKDSRVIITEQCTKAYDGHIIKLYWYHTETIQKAAVPGPAVLHIHGGGMIAGSVKLFSNVLASYTAASDIPFLSVEYRLAPEVHGITIVEDCFAGLTWLHKHAKELNIDSARIAVMGESAGGGIAAGLALYARDLKLEPRLAKQILIYPMLDDSNTDPDDELEPFAIWSNADNITGWTALLGKEVLGTDKTPLYAAPARATVLSGLPPAYIDVGGLDIFRDEDIEYSGRLGAANVGVEFHLHPGVPHLYELLAPESDVAKRTIADRIKALQSF
jgi:acetyl esterase/lipase